MDDKPTKVTSSQVMELQQLIAAPLIATIEADTLSSQRYLDYLMKIAFESYDPATGQTGRMRMLTFNYRSTDVNGSRTQSVSIPIFTLVPLPLLQIQEADFDFDIKILDALTETAEERFSIGEQEETDEAQQPEGFRLRASLAPKQQEGSTTSNVQQSLSANMKVRVKMRPADMPAGLTNLLHLAANNTQVEEVGSEEEVPEGGDDE